VISPNLRDYVTAARMNGAGTALMFSEVLPNCTGAADRAGIAGHLHAILDAAALGFLGLGAQPPSPEWGTMLADAREFVLRAWWVVTFRACHDLITVLAFNLLGDGLRDALDPKLKR
jgi:dipeptide transport system permease protein